MSQIWPLSLSCPSLWSRGIVSPPRCFLSKCIGQGYVHLQVHAAGQRSECLPISIQSYVSWLLEELHRPAVKYIRLVCNWLCSNAKLLQSPGMRSITGGWNLARTKTAESTRESWCIPYWTPAFSCAVPGQEDWLTGTPAVHCLVTSDSDHCPPGHFVWCPFQQVRAEISFWFEPSEGDKQTQWDHHRKIMACPALAHF